MKILFIQGEHPQGKIGGAELQSWLLAKELAQKHHVIYLAIRSDVKDDQDSVIDNVRVVKLIKSKKHSLKEFLNILNAVKKLSPGIIHLRIFEYITCFTLISRMCKIPVIFHASHIFDCQLFDGRKTNILNHLRHALNYLSLGMVSGIVCQTQDQRRALCMLKLPLCVISNSARSLIASNCEAQKDENLILWVGNIKSIKQPLLFVDLASLLKSESVKFLMIGYPRDAELANKVRKMSNDIPNFEFIPGIPIEQIDPYFRKARIFVCTSAGEGYPNTFIQAMQARTPIVSLNIDPDDVLKEYKVGVQSGNIENLKTDLVLLLKNKSMLLEMQKNMRNCLNEKFSVVSNANALENFFYNYSSQEI